MGNELFCKTCDELRQSTEKLTTVTHDIKGEEMKIDVMLPFCVECGSQLSDLEIEEKHFDLALCEYRKRNGLLSPEEISRIRKSYSLSQRAFARALGFSEPTINRYELGAIQDSAHNSIILLAKEPENMKILAFQNKDSLSVKELNMILDKVNEPKQSESRNLSSLDLIEKLVQKIEGMDKTIVALDNKLDSFMKESRQEATRISPLDDDIWPDFDLEKMLKPNLDLSRAPKWGSKLKKYI